MSGQPVTRVDNSASIRAGGTHRAPFPGRLQINPTRCSSAPELANSGVGGRVRACSLAATWIFFYVGGHSGFGPARGRMGERFAAQLLERDPSLGASGGTTVSGWLGTERPFRCIAGQRSRNHGASGLASFGNRAGTSVTCAFSFVQQTAPYW